MHNYEQPAAAIFICFAYLLSGEYNKRTEEEMIIHFFACYLYVFPGTIMYGLPD